MIERALRHLPPGTALVLNADDPRVAFLAPDLKNPRLYFGMADSVRRRDGADPTSDFPRCPRCGAELSYDCVFYAHLGHYRCTSCGLVRPEPQVSVTELGLTGPSSTRLQLTTPAGSTVLEIPLPGFYNAYNALAAVATATCCELPHRSFPAIEQVTAAALRMERVTVAGHDVYLALAKNANGYTEVLRAVLCDGQPRRTLLGLNDCPGKQPDTSWIWDVDFDGLTGLVPAPVVTGNRAADLAVRLKYAGGSVTTPGRRSRPNPTRSGRSSRPWTRRRPANRSGSSRRRSCLMRIRRWLYQQGYVRQIWQDADHYRANAARLPAGGRPLARRPVTRLRLPEPESALSTSVLGDATLHDTVISTNTRRRPRKASR